MEEQLQEIEFSAEEQPQNQLLEKLRSKVASHPSSPLFARLAALTLEDGDVDAAIALCEQGTKEWPEYVTGFLVTAQCYLVAKKYDLSDAALTHILSLHPRHPMALQLKEDVTSARAGGPISFQITPKKKSESAPTVSASIESFEDFSKRVKKDLDGMENTLALDAYISSSDDGQHSIEQIATQLQNAKPIQPPQQIPPSNPSPGVRQAPNPTIATLTLAEIYSQQGQYTEAIATYQKLMDQNPADRVKYSTKIEELKKLLDAHGFGSV